MALLSHSLPRPLPVERMGGTGHMGRSSAVRIVALAMLLLAALPGASQQKSLKEQLLDLGTWILVSHEPYAPDGSRAPVYGLNPNGIAFFDAGGHFIITAMRSDRAKYAIAMNAASPTFDFGAGSDLDRQRGACSRVRYYVSLIRAM